MRIWTYVITSDLGGAPNFAPPATTLVLCKPAIRRGAASGDLVFAFNGAEVEDGVGFDRFPDPNTVRWAGIIGEAISLADYWSDPRFARKKPGTVGMPDNICEPYEGGYRQVDNETHGPESLARDVRGRNALIFSRSWYFGRAGPSLAESFGLSMGGRNGGGRQGHRVHEEAGRAKQLIHWLENQPPMQPVVSSPCNKGRSCGPRAAKVRPRDGCGSC